MIVRERRWARRGVPTVNNRSAVADFTSEQCPARLTLLFAKMKVSILQSGIPREFCVGQVRAGEIELIGANGIEHVVRSALGNSPNDRHD